jgi:hypothetical protein
MGFYSVRAKLGRPERLATRREIMINDRMGSVARPAPLRRIRRTGA